MQRTGRALFVDGPRRYSAMIENLNDEAINLKVDEAYPHQVRGKRCGAAPGRLTAGPRKAIPD